MKWIQCSVVLCLVLGISLASVDHLRSLPKDSLQSLFKDEIVNRFKTKKTTDAFDSLVEIFKLPKPLKRVDEVAPKNDMMCTLCNSVLGAYMDLIRNDGASAQEVGDSVMELCTMLSISTERVCQGAIFKNVNEIHYIVEQRPNLSTDQLCGIIFQSSCPTDDLDAFQWTVDIDPNHPPLTGSKDTSVPPSAGDIKVAHIADPHYDPSYMAGAWAACDEYNCCRYDQPIPEGEDASVVGAGRWGDYRDCDSPLDAVIDAFTDVARRHSDLDYVYFTGDIVDHAIWATTKTHNEQAISRINRLLTDVFRDIPVFPVLGNHEPHPTNLFAPSSVPEEYSTQWLYDFIADEWSQWLPADALETVRLGGYYTMSLGNGLRIITINNNECYTYNWWVAYELPENARKQLQWMHDTLLQAERDGEKVHILGHVPVGSGDCFQIYAREYRRIVDRFWNTISAQFCGHSHKDEFHIFYHSDEGRSDQALNVLWNGGSTTAYSDVNPNYKIYTMDTTTFQINSHQTWSYNLTAANLNPNQTPAWFLEYDFAEEYGLDNLSPRALSGLMDNFARNENLLRRYWELKYSMADSTLAVGCDRDCLANHMCAIVTTEVSNSPRCEALRAVWNAGN